MESHVARFNLGVRTGDWEPMLARFADDAELRFQNAAAGAFAGIAEIRRAYRDQPPDDEIEVLEAEERGDGLVVARYAWAAEPANAAGELRLLRDGERIAELVVTFGFGS